VLATLGTLVTENLAQVRKLVRTRPCPQGELVARGLLVKVDSSYQVAKVAEIF